MIGKQTTFTFPYEAPHCHLIFDRDAKFSLDVVAAVRAMGCEPTRTSFRSSWQNGIAERWVESCRRDLLDHVIVRDERHLKRLLCDYVRCYHDDRMHLGLAKQTPGGRVRVNAIGNSPIVSVPRMGGLHHRYDLAA